MFKFFICVIVLVVLLFVVSFKLSDVKAKRDLAAHLHEYHNNKYEILTFKRNFNAANMNPNLYWVELELKENKEIIISFEWNAKNKDLHFSFHNSKDRSIESLTRYQQEVIVLEKELLALLKDDALNVDVDVFNHTLDVSLEAEPTLDDFHYFSEKICKVVTNYPDAWDLEGHVYFKIKGEKKGFYELILIPNTIDDSNDSFRYKHNAIVTNNYGSVKAEYIDQVIQKEFSKPDAPVYLNQIWVHQKCFNTFYISFTKHAPQENATENNRLTEGVGVGVVKMTYPNLELDTYTYYDYKTTSKEGINHYLISQLPEDYQFLVSES
ncbi:hypothetical protein PXD56_09870 [Maribacter sp. SA7]|uniref:hypothetical protein n=1 Tax=Maribacter zhoushanensis TaxID=3030012 RepID=UPI0023EAE701|nr:hypothetical protein [Maribacter zhoushanensis]MDF4203262.1 hypothetical protein [Maribacter zhoushanensis]